MKRLFLALPLLALLGGRAFADCSTLTPNMGLAPCTMGTSWSVVGPAWIGNWSLLDFSFTSPLTRSGVNVSLGTVAEIKGGTNQTTYVKGDTLYASATNVLSKLNGNTSTTRKFREQHGSGSAVTVDAWDTIQAADITTGTIAPARIVATPTNSRCLRITSGGVIEVDAADCNSPLITSGHAFNAANADSTVPMKVGTTPPATCSIGQFFYDSDATAGSNIYACTATDTWTLEGGVGGGGSSILPFPCQLTPGGATDYCGPATSVGNTTAQAALVPMTGTGSFTKLYCGSSAAPGAGPQTIVYTAQKNGTPEASLTCTQSGGASFNCNDTGTLSYVAGDNVYIEAVSSAGNAATTATCTLS